MPPPATKFAVRRRFRKTPGQGPDQSNSWFRIAMICALLAAGTFALYSPVSGYGFLDYDDGSYVTENPHVRTGLSWETIRWSLRSTEHANWHPLTWISHIVDYHLYGPNAGGHHITSLLIHMLNVVLLFLLLWRVSGEPGRSFMVAALFAWHPFNVESVIWIAERKNVLSTLFLLLTVAAYGWYARHPEWKRYGLVILLFALGLAAKPMLVTLPFALLLLDYWPLQRVAGWSEASTEFPMPQFSFRRLVAGKVPLLLLSAASAAITVIAQRRGGALYSKELLPYGARLENALWSYGMYVWKTLWPFGFAIHYPNPFDPRMSSRPTLWIWCELMVSASMLFGVSLFVWKQRRARPYLLTGWLWYLGTLVPVIGIVQVGMQGMADRYAYVPLIGIFVMLVWGVGSLASYARLSRNLRWGVAAAVLLSLVFLSFRQIGRWESNYTLWSYTADVTGENFLAADHLGLILQQTGRPGSVGYFQEAVRIAPWDPVSRYAVAMNLEDQGLHQDAIREYEAVIRQPMTDRFLALAEANVGIIYGELGDYSKSDEHLQQSLQADPSAIDSLIRDFTQSISQRPLDATYVQLGILLAQLGRIDEARFALEQVLSRNPGAREARILLNHLNEGSK